MYLIHAIENSIQIYIYSYRLKLGIMILYIPFIDFKNKNFKLYSPKNIFRAIKKILKPQSFVIMELRHIRMSAPSMYGHMLALPLFKEKIG